MLRKILLGGSAAALPFLFVAPSQAEDVSLKVSSCLIKGHDQVVAYFKTFHDPINKMNAGLKLNYIGGPEVTPSKNQAAALKRGLIDIINCPSAYYSNLVPAARLTGASNVLPAELRTNGGWDILQEAWKKGLNARLLAAPAWKTSSFYIYMNRMPNTNEKSGLDLSGIKMRSNALYRPLLQAMGATPVTISPGDVYAALERGVVDGLPWPEGSVSKYGWEKFIKYKIGPSFYHTSTMTIINDDVFNKLSKKHQDIVLKQSLIHEEASNAHLTPLMDEDNKKLKKAGVKDINLEGKVGAAFLRTVYDAKWAENDKTKYRIDYKKLRPLMYKQQ